MATFVPAKRATAYILYVGLVSQANTKILRVNPTLATGDFKVSIDGGALANLATLPTVTPAAGALVKISLSAAEMTGDNLTVHCLDAAGAEWCDLLINIQTAARQIDDLAYPATSGRSMVVDAAGLVDANTVKLGPTGGGTAQTAKDVGGAVPAVAAGASGGILISGSNSGTTTLGALTVTAATVLTGNVSMAAGLNITQSVANTSALVVTGNGTGHGGVITSGAGATGDGLQVTAASTNGGGLRLTKTGTGLALVGATTDLTLAKTTNLTGLNDIAATAVVSAGAITTNAGKVSGVILADTVTTYTGNTLQTGDSFARIGAAGVSLTAVALAAATSNAVIAGAVWDAATITYGAAGSYGLLVETNLDATVSSRLATAGYTAPSNLTAAQIATGIWTDTTAGDFTVNLSVGKSVMNGVALGTGLTIVSASGSVGSVVGAVGSVTGLTAANLDTTVSSRATPVQVKTQMTDALNVDAYAEPGQATPAATTTLTQKIGYLFKAWRNRSTQTAADYKLFNDDAITVDQKATTSDDATTFDRTEITTGP